MDFLNCTNCKININKYQDVDSYKLSYLSEKLSTLGLSKYLARDEKYAGLYLSVGGYDKTSKKYIALELLMHYLKHCSDSRLHYINYGIGDGNKFNGPNGLRTHRMSRGTLIKEILGNEYGGRCSVGVIKRAIVERKLNGVGINVSSCEGWTKLKLYTHLEDALLNCEFFDLYFTCVKYGLLSVECTVNETNIFEMVQLLISCDNWNEVTKLSSYGMSSIGLFKLPMVCTKLLLFVKFASVGKLFFENDVNEVYRKNLVYYTREGLCQLCSTGRINIDRVGECFICFIIPRIHTIGNCLLGCSECARVLNGESIQEFIKSFDEYSNVKNFNKGVYIRIFNEAKRGGLVKINREGEAQYMEVINQINEMVDVVDECVFDWKNNEVIAKKVKISSAMKYAVWKKYIGNYVDAICPLCESSSINPFSFKCRFVYGNACKLDNLRAICKMCYCSMKGIELVYFAEKYYPNTKIHETFLSSFSGYGEEDSSEEEDLLYMKSNEIIPTGILENIGDF